MNNQWYKKPSVVYGYEDTLMAYKISKILNFGLFLIVLIAIWVVVNANHTVKELKDLVFAKDDIIIQLQTELANKANEVEKLQARIDELESINNSAQDIQNYIKAYHPEVPKVVAVQISETIMEKAKEHSVPVPAIVGVMDVESNFNPYAVSSKGARGLMQVMYKVWGKKLELKNPHELHDIETGIDSGCEVLRNYLDQTENDMKKALYKYVGGDNNYGRQVYEAMGRYVIFRSFSKMKVTKDEPVVEPLKEIDLIRAQKEKSEYVEIKPIEILKPLVHKIKYQGETLGIIAKWYTGDDDNWKEIIKVNPNLKPEKLMLGQDILIPHNLLKNRTPLSKEFIGSL